MLEPHQKDLQEIIAGRLIRQVGDERENDFVAGHNGEGESVTMAEADDPKSLDETIDDTQLATTT